MPWSRPLMTDCRFLVKTEISFWGFLNTAHRVLTPFFCRWPAVPSSCLDGTQCSIVALSQFDRVDGQASNKVEGESATASNNKDNVSRRRKGVASSASEEVDDEEKMEKIGEDIALLKLDDKIYWNRFLQSSGSMSESPSAAPTTEDGDDDDDDDDDGEYM